MKTTIDDLFGLWGTVPQMAEDVGVTAWVAHKWRQRGRIPPEHWSRVVSAASRKGKKLSADDLLVMHSKRTSPAARASR